MKVGGGDASKEKKNGKSVAENMNKLPINEQ